MKLAKRHFMRLAPRLQQSRIVLCILAWLSCNSGELRETFTFLKKKNIFVTKDFRESVTTI